MSIQAFDYSVKEPHIVCESDSWAVLYKPSGLPTAPLIPSDKNTLLFWFLSYYPEAKKVRGKKEIEAGLIHRLDTATQGLVLLAKTQESYDAFVRFQKENLISKTYFAFCSIKNFKDFDKDSIKHAIMSKEAIKLKSTQEKLWTDGSLTLKSQFKNYGPKAKKVMPLFEGDRGFIPEKKLYTTNIMLNEKNDTTATVQCTLSKGYRHQVRSHLAFLGLPIIDDALYNLAFREHYESSIIESHSYPLQLYAVGIEFPNPLLDDYSKESLISVVLPQPSKRNQ